ncbi:biotin synthase [Acidothermus cellulolyticus 11B]|uniref:Biotin synthase n=1 Tax=Acidothermus cellulolyticus (strain ATCC 43068 / DSM 8971 / 11B) TaxID=351607 RepID=BIOB_ACIC1|nr:biotin synthase BioB [Acidothermus cellulolyticus]A0LTP8.1 RecName: Full=Biotin synthase [Acidothermus cellulolyticus 11B]ABK52808.1 biotin synthase [Acidothermus cellulolyticus 11B]
MTDVLASAERVLRDGIGLTEPELRAVLDVDDDSLPRLLDLAHRVRRRWCGPGVEIEGIVSVKTGGCPEDCHFCSQSGRFDSPVRSAWLDIPNLVTAAEQTAATGATEFCIVAAVRGPDDRLMRQVRAAVRAIREAVDINISCSLGILTPDQAAELAEIGVHRYNHNLETARSYFPSVVTTHTWEERWQTLQLVRAAGMEVCCGGILGMGESLDQRAEFAAQLADLDPDEVPLNFLDPRPGTPFADLPVVSVAEALRAAAMFRLALPRTILRFAGGREITLGDAGTRDALRGGVNGLIVGNYLTTLGRDPAADLALLAELGEPIRRSELQALSQAL